MSNRDELHNLLIFPSVLWMFLCASFWLAVAHAAAYQAGIPHPDVPTAGKEVH